LKHTQLDLSVKAHRRDGLKALLGAAALTFSLPARLSFAASSGDKANSEQRLVVVLLRGALDGLAAVPATGDPAWADLRGHSEAILRSQAQTTAAAIGINSPNSQSSSALLPLDSTFGFHPGLKALHQWYSQKELLVIHAVASPYRERSHFDAQQLLESGGDMPFSQSTGWLGRALQSSGLSAMALTASMPLALRGADTASTWTPKGHVSKDQDLVMRVAQMYGNDAPLANAIGQAMGQMGMSMGADDAQGLTGLASQAGKFLANPNGPRVAWLEAGGWDTHTQQVGRLGRLLPILDDSLAALRNSLGQHWSTTTVLVMTEFGRSAALNGSGGTDHGTGGVAFLAGGQIAGGRVLADWPGLSKGNLLDGRDLRPTLDIRSLIGPVAERQFGLNSVAMKKILPGAPEGLRDLFRA
jgi:uncharacterized protein (DUF1501 family)